MNIGISRYVIEATSYSYIFIDCLGTTNFVYLWNILDLLVLIASKNNIV